MSDSGEVFIYDSELLELQRGPNFGSGQIMKEKGAPMTGLIYPQPHPDYMFTYEHDYEKRGTKISWIKI